jgi:hypothetical protein
MTDHSSAIVPIESWCYCSPEVKACGKSIDIGLFAEALIYYDRVLVNIGNQPQLAEFIRWFISQNRFEDFLSLVMDGTVTIYEYSFMTTAIHDKRTGNYSIWNIQDPVQKEPNTFEKRFLYHKTIEELLPKARHRKRLYDTLRGNVIEVKADEIGNTIENARKDYQNSGRNTLILQAFVDELYKFRKLGHPPDIIAQVTNDPEGSKHRITWNIDFSKISELAGKELNFHLGTPLTAGALSNRLLWSSAQVGCDLFLPQPMSVLVGDKLYESTERIAKAGTVIEELKAKVEFPNVRVLVNDEKLNLKEILKIRAKARKFRDWLQSESERDRDAIIAYHNETARELGLITAGRKALSIFGVIGSGAAGSLIGTAMAGPIGAAIGGAAGSATGYLADIVSKIGANWRPVIFGNWFRTRIEKFIRGPL